MERTGYTLITGGAGFIGSNLADALLADGEEVVLLDNLSRPGVVRNAEWLKRTYDGAARLEVGDITDLDLVGRLVRGARRVYHLAAQVAVTTSLEDPADDFRTNLTGTFNVLEAARTMDRPPMILFTSTNKVYGGLDGVDVAHDGDRYVFEDGRAGIDESTPLDFHSPYGCSKGAADQYVRDYARIFDIPTVVLRMSCIYGRRQWGTEDQGWVAHFGRAILAGEPITIYGDGHQVRDILWVGDLVRAMRLAVEREEETAGEIFNVGGGASQAVTVREVVERLMAITDREVAVEMGAWRPGDQRVYVTDTSKMEARLDWAPRVGVDEGLTRLVEWLDEARVEGEAAKPMLRPARAGRAMKAAS